MYADLIREDAARLGRIDVDPKLVEAWMRVEHDTLDALSRRQFAAEVAIAIGCVDAAGVEASHRVAESMGLR